MIVPHSCGHMWEGEPDPHLLPPTPPARDADVKGIGQLSPEVTPDTGPEPVLQPGPSAAASVRALRVGPVMT